MVNRASLGQFEQLVLAAVLGLDEEAYGVTIHREVERLMDPRGCQQGAVYATLDRLEEKGLVSSWHSEPLAERGGRRRRHYRLSESGKAALAESIEVARRICAVADTHHHDRRWRPA